MNYDIDEKSGQVTPLTHTMAGLELIPPPKAQERFTTETYQVFIKKTLDDLQTLIRQKQADYVNGKGPFANFEQATDFGVDPFKGLMVRLGDKFQRIKSYCSKGELQVKNEGVEDALLDVIGYSLIALAMFDEKKRGAK